MSPEELRAVVARNVRAFAAAKNVSLTHLADFATVSRSQLFALLDGVGGSLAMVAKLAAALGVEPWQLLKPDARPNRVRARRKAPKPRR